ncbi:hypothetical protein MMC08_006374 [Hypocenomyce scalaris]|nr:hypothetical protein [Hypocenomyce scalaris]
MQNLESDGTASFHFTNGAYEVNPPPGFGDWFGGPPHTRFLRYEGEETATDLLAGLRDFPDMELAEETMRELFSNEHLPSRQNMRAMLDGLQRVMEEEGPFEGVIGYSEGALVAATLLLDEKARWQKAAAEGSSAKKGGGSGSGSMLKCAIFFSGWPPIAPEGGCVILADESEEVIDVPTCHVLGASDPWVQGCMALYNICDAETAQVFDHGRGHLVPRDSKTVEELGNVVREFVSGIKAM